MKILIVNTDSEVAQDVRMTLNRCQPDWQLTVIDAGQQYMDIIKSEGCPDAVILGMQLSDTSGFELTELIRDDCDVPVILLSAKNDIEVLIKAFDAGANDFIAVPFNKAIFVARLKALIRRKKWDIQAMTRKTEEVQNRQIKYLSSCSEHGNAC